MHIEHSEYNDQLVRGLTHKMNNILSLFHGYLGLLLENKELDPATLKGLGRIQEGARVASDLMDRTKALARPSSVVWREINPADFLHMLKPAIDTLCEREVTVEISCDEEVPPLWSDTARLRMAFIELVRNAVESSPPRGVVMIHVGVETQPTVGENFPVPPIQWISVAVTNAGPKIPAVIAAKMFQPFFTTRRKNSAPGLGLTVALGLVQQLGGVIRFHTEDGATTFRLLLPSRLEET